MIFPVLGGGYAVLTAKTGGKVVFILKAHTECNIANGHIRML